MRVDVAQDLRDCLPNEQRQRRFWCNVELARGPEERVYQAWHSGRELYQGLDVRLKQWNRIGVTYEAYNWAHFCEGGGIADGLRDKHA